jgi:hypothetical protein
MSSTFLEVLRGKRLKRPENYKKDTISAQSEEKPENRAPRTQAGKSFGASIQRLYNFGQHLHHVLWQPRKNPPANTQNVVQTLPNVTQTLPPSLKHCDGNCFTPRKNDRKRRSQKR